MENKRQVGFDYEKLTAEYLKSRGYVIVRQNFYTRVGEADIIALDGEVLAFIEVKYRATGRFGTAAEAITASKKHRIINVARVFVMKNARYADRSIRFDVVAIDGDRINLIKNAFDAF